MVAGSSRGNDRDALNVIFDTLDSLSKYADAQSHGNFEIHIWLNSNIRWFQHVSSFKYNTGSMMVWTGYSTATGDKMPPSGTQKIPKKSFQKKTHQKGKEKEASAISILGFQLVMPAVRN